ncbi:multiprotein-bridging factor 1 family protein [Kitasatospora sp. NPDC059327]|uniref:helix-turn-helix domain-containing protein n=1 Tax=Kitasatospora sp. NPDC059327 TaxID=3346803 RepID=UPI0036B84DE6
MRAPHRTAPLGVPALVQWGGPLNWNSAVVREASRTRDYGRVIELARTHRRMTQAQLGEMCGLSQSAVSRLEKRGTSPYAMDVLLRMSEHLDIPAALVGLAGPTIQARSGAESVQRRQFLGVVAAAAASPALAVAGADPVDEGEQQAASLRLVTMSYRRLDGSTPSGDLADAVHSHLRLIRKLVRTAPTDGRRTGLIAAASEAASLAGWLAWDTGDNGSARSFYGAAVKTARSGTSPLLAAYQAGSLAQFEAHTGNGVQALSLVRRARGFLDSGSPAVADAWLSAVEALGHAATGDQRSADRSLVHSRTVVQADAVAEPPPWPWVFVFDESKVAGFRLTCGAKLGLSRWVSESAGPVLTSGNPKQRALLVLDIAAGHLAAGRVEAAFTLATQALEVGRQFRSGRIVERGRALRRSFRTSSPPKVVREFDERMYDMHL